MMHGQQNVKFRIGVLVLSKNDGLFTRLVYSQPAHDTATNTEWQLPEAVLIQSVSPDDEHDMLETCREL